VNVAAGGEEGRESEDEQYGEADGEVPGEAVRLGRIVASSTLDQDRLILWLRKTHRVWKV
jgi:hypothetical protein